MQTDGAVGSSPLWYRSFLASVILGKYNISYPPDKLHNEMSVLWRERIIMVDSIIERVKELRKKQK